MIMHSFFPTQSDLNFNSHHLAHYSFPVQNIEKRKRTLPKAPDTMPQFNLSVRSFTTPELAKQQGKGEATGAADQPSYLVATSPLSFTVAVQSSRAKDPLYPATHLQLAYGFPGVGEIFDPSLITSKELMAKSTTNDDDDDESKLYTVRVRPADIPRTRLNVEEAARHPADVHLYAWRGEKYLGKWDLGSM
ncbi:hypothetical protein BX600DRAFT_302369 [Xylariales sp. PMI_506]|nr:hypothetical protein BX600DRAFT_302369 [Xylariales sp. PMI_506]